MEQACADGNLRAVKDCFEALFAYEDKANDTVNITMLPCAPNLIGESLCLAATNGHVPIVEFLLEQGAPITRKLIQTVCHTERVKIFEAMLRHGWDVNEWKSDTPPLR